MARGGEDAGSLLGLVEGRLVAHHRRNLQAGLEPHHRHPAEELPEVGIAQPTLAQVPASRFDEDAVHIDDGICALRQVAIQLLVLQGKGNVSLFRRCSIKDISFY